MRATIKLKRPITELELDVDENSIIPQRMHGHWTEDNSCPFCGKQPWYEHDIHTLSFCPYCGADMREEQDDDK